MEPSTSNNGLLSTEISKEDILRTPTSTTFPPVEEMLGSVTTYNTPEGVDQNSGKVCQQLRTSARVIKKLKLDSSLTGVGGSSSEKDKTKESKDDDKHETKTKVNRPKVVWSQEDKTHFFDAIKEYGKDFDAIHDYISSKYKKKGISENQIKTKEQVRHFYYRTWHKVSKYLKFSDEVKKVVQEYYALINYGELRRKIGVTSEKTCVKLNELMYRGATQIRIRGKTVRIKTPMCRTLRRLNQIDERPEDLKLPTKVLVELRPRDMDTWMYVQEMGQNPRVQCTLPLQKRLHVLLSHLNSKWRTNEQRAYDKTFTNQATTSNNNEEKLPNGDDKKFPVNPILRVAPKSDTAIQIPHINYSEFLTNCRISLNAYEERMGIKNRGEPIWLASINNSKSVNKLQQPVKKGTKRARNDSTGEKFANEKNNTTSGEKSSNIKKEHFDNEDVSEIIDSVVNTILALSHDNVDETEKSEQSDLIKLENKTENLKQRQLAIETIRTGWTPQDTETISIGELYLMIGNDSKIDLEYWWDTSEIKKEQLTEQNDATVNNSIVDETKVNKITVVLDKLISLAKLYYRKEKVECPCGHVCGASNRPSTSYRNKIVPNLKNVHRIEAKPYQPEGVSTMEEVSLTTTNMITQRSDGIFRLPIPPNFISRQNSALEAFKAKLDSLRPKYCQRRGRTVRSKQVVVQRTLPLLPKTASNDQSILTMKVIPQGSLASDFVPIAPKFSSVTTVDSAFVQTKPTQHSIALSPIPMEDTAPSPPITNLLPTDNHQDTILAGDVTVIGTTTSGNESAELDINSSTNLELNIPPPSPTPTIGTLLDIVEMSTATEKSDSTSSCSNANNILLENSSTFVTDFLNENARGIETPLSASPSRLLKEDDVHWLNSEVADFSLSSFLGHLESPVKATSVITSCSSNVNNDDSRMSQDMEAQLQSLMSENSIDYMAKFADLAAQMASDTQKK